MTDPLRPRPRYDPDYKRRRSAEQQAPQQAADDAKRAKQATMTRAVVVPVSEWRIAWALLWRRNRRGQHEE